MFFFIIILVEALTLETHLEDSTVLRPPRSSASVPDLQHGYPGSCRPSKGGQGFYKLMYSGVCVCVSQFSVCLEGGAGFLQQVGKHECQLAEVKRWPLRNCSQRALPVPVGVPLVLDNQILLMDGLKQSCGQGLEVGDRLWRGWQAAALLFQEHLLD